MMRVLPVTLDQLLRLRQKTSDDQELHDFTKQLEGLIYYGGRNYQLMLVDDDGTPVDEETLLIMQLLWSSSRYQQVH